MGWKGTIRSIQAANRRMEREAKRREKELARRQREIEKMEALEQAAYEVDVFENYIERIQSVHKECSDSIHWDKLSKQPAPKQPSLSNSNELKAKQDLEEFKPNFFQNLFKRSERITEQLKEKVEIAKQQDKQEYENALTEFETESANWKSTQELAKNVLDSNSEALIEVLKGYGSFSEIDELGTNLIFSIEEGAVSVEAHVHGEDIIPAETKSLLKSGKLSIKKTPKGVYYELYQDYVCSCVLRIAREIFALLPIKSVTITALDEILNSVTGHLEKQPILSVLIPKKTLEKMNLDMIDPSDSMGNFIHNMGFKKTKGFAPVKKVHI